MPDWIFDGANKIIKEPVGTGNTSFDFKRDIYSAWKRWVQSGNMQYDQAISQEGGTPIGATGLFTGLTFLLENGWTLMAADHDHQCIVIGNFYSTTGVISTPNPIGNSTIFASGTVGAQGISTGSGVTAQDKQEIIDGVNTEQARYWTADEEKNVQTNKYYKRDKDTQEVLVEKDYAKDVNDNETLTQP